MSSWGSLISQEVNKFRCFVLEFITFCLFPFKLVIQPLPLAWVNSARERNWAFSAQGTIVQTTEVFFLPGCSCNWHHTASGARVAHACGLCLGAPHRASHRHGPIRLLYWYRGGLLGHGCYWPWLLPLSGVRSAHGHAGPARHCSHGEKTVAYLSAVL